MSLEGKRIGFIGAGAMAEALAGGVLASGIPAESVAAADPDPVRRKHLSETLGVTAVADNGEIVRDSDIVVLAVKPNVVGPVLEGLADAPEGEHARPLWISIAAGIPLARLEGGLGEAARIVRAMPNTPALVQAGATAFCGNHRATARDRDSTRDLFRCVGTVWEAPSEALLDAVTGLSGSGPAYVFVFLEALGDAGVRMGLPRPAAYDLAFQTVFGPPTIRWNNLLGSSAGFIRSRVASGDTNGLIEIGNTTLGAGLAFDHTNGLQVRTVPHPMGAGKSISTQFYPLMVDGTLRYLALYD